MSLAPNHRRIDEVSSATLNTKTNQKISKKPNSWRAQKPSNLTDWVIYIISFFQPTRKHRPSGYWRYALGVYKNLFLSFYFNWFVIFTAPLSSFAFILAYPIISGLLFAFELGLKLFMDGLGGDHLAKLISRDYGGGFSMINWGAPELLLSEQTSDLIKATVPSLCEPPAFIADHRHRVFDVSIAQTMTVLSTLVYERDDDKMQQAFRMQDIETKDVEKKMEQLIWESESPIRHITSLYDLEFAGVTECKSLCGPFCGLYWSETHPVIIVAFKGTTPTNYSEFMVDATLQRTDARTYLFGSAHEGFYDSLFPTHMDNEDSKDPYYAIQVALIERAKQLQVKFGPDPVHVWVTGHSLGAAIGSLLFARWLKCPEDIEPYCTLRDCYVIGTPAVGDSEFASYFASYSNMPLSRTSTLWRVINQMDVICRVPPGYNSSTVGHYAPTTDFFNYSHVGHAIQITHPILSSKPIKAYPSSYESNLEVVLASGKWKSTWSHGMAQKEYKHANKQESKYARTEDASYSAWTKATLNRLGLDPISFIESFYPFFIRDHIPIHYFNGLERARQYCLEREKENQ